MGSTKVGYDVAWFYGMQFGWEYIDDLPDDEIKGILTIDLLCVRFAVVFLR